jgi:plasmid stabilization system protein ParE
MSYRVEWTPAAESELTSIWLNSHDRNLVTTATIVNGLILAIPFSAP